MPDSTRTISTLGSPTPEEAAAIAAAIDRFLEETAPGRAAAEGGQALDPWTRAAMLEGVAREDRVDVPHPWITG